MLHDQRNSNLSDSKTQENAHTSKVGGGKKVLY